MDSLRNLTPAERTTSQKNSPVKSESYDIALQTLIDYRALNGLITDDDGMRKMTVDELAKMLNVSRITLYDWQNKTPDFWELVNQRRTEIAPKSRLAKMHEVWYMSALLPKNFQDRQLWLYNFDPKFRLPTAKIQHEIGDSFAEMAKMLKERDGAKPEPLEGEIIDNADTNN